MNMGMNNSRRLWTLGQSVLRSGYESTAALSECSVGVEATTVSGHSALTGPVFRKHHSNALTLNRTNGRRKHTTAVQTRKHARGLAHLVRMQISQYTGMTATSATALMPDDNVHCEATAGYCNFKVSDDADLMSPVYEAE